MHRKEYCNNQEEYEEIGIFWTSKFLLLKNTNRRQEKHWDAGEVRLSANFLEIFYKTNSLP